MSVVTLVSGGLDSTTMAALIQEQGLDQWPLFVDYGQLGREREIAACRVNLKRLGLPEPAVIDLRGYGAFLPSGITDASLHIQKEAFLPGRNAMFLLAAGSYGHRVNARTVYIGLLSEAYSLFPDQTESFIRDMETLLCRALGAEMRVIAPLMKFSKREIVAMAKELGISGTYSCHRGGAVPCGVCIACREFDGTEV